MNRPARKILFYSVVIIFLVVGGYLVMTAQGLVFDWENFGVKKTGAIFLKFSPADAELTVNGEPTKYLKRGLIQNNGILIKNLPPDDYLLRLSKEGYYDWGKKLNVESGIVTAASQINLWPKEIPSQPLIKERVKDFWLTSRGLVYKNEDDDLVFNESFLRGDDVALAKKDEKFIVTTENQQTYFLVDLEDSRSAINLNNLFNSLKQRQLNLPGVVPVKAVFDHPFSADKFLIQSQTSLYTIDIKKIQIEKLATLEDVKTVALSNNEAFIVGEERSLVIINLLLRTSSEEKTDFENVKNIKTNSLGTKFFILTSKDELKIYDRPSKRSEVSAPNVKNIYLDQNEKRIAVITTDNKLKVLYLNQYKGDVKYEAGTLIEILASGGGELKDLTWLDRFLNYLIVLKDKNLIVQELDVREPTNSHIIFNRVIKYDLEGKNLYILRDNGELIAFSTVASS